MAKWAFSELYENLEKKRLAILLILSLAHCPQVLWSQAIKDSFREGVRDHNAWDDWIASTTGSFRDGAVWVERQPIMSASDCSHTGPVRDSDWVAGCQAAVAKKATIVAKEQSDPEYESGWMAPNKANRANIAIQ